MNVKAYNLGAAEEVTGSSTIFEINGKKYMIDCGAFQNEDAYDKNLKKEIPTDIEACILTHCHYDHTGLLPLLLKKGYKEKIYSTPATRDLTAVVLMDSAKIQQVEKQVLYKESEAIKVMDKFSCQQYGKEKKINDELSFTFYNSGHVLGSAMVDLAISKSNWLPFLNKNKKTHILCAWDMGRENNPLINSPEKNIPAPEYIFLESTYGDKTHESIETVYQELTYVINRTISRGGKVLVPSFAIERAQEIIFFIKVLMAKNKIPRVPIYIDSPMASNATGVFNIHPECFNEDIVNNFFSEGKNPFSVKSLKFISSHRESICIAKSKKPAIIIAGNGMCEAGRILNHLKYGIENPNNTILIVGYMSENTLGRKILAKEENLVIDEEKRSLKAEVQRINAFSAHADYKEMLKWLKSIDTSKLKKIFLVHGEKEPQIFFKSFLRKNGFNAEIVKLGETYNLK